MSDELVTNNNHSVAKLSMVLTSEDCMVCKLMRKMKKVYHEAEIKLFLIL